MIIVKNEGFSEEDIQFCESLSDEFYKKIEFKMFAKNEQEKYNDDEPQKKNFKIK